MFSGSSPTKPLEAVSEALCREICRHGRAVRFAFAASEARRIGGARPRTAASALLVAPFQLDRRDLSRSAYRGEGCPEAGGALRPAVICTATWRRPVGLHGASFFLSANSCCATTEVEVTTHAARSACRQKIDQLEVQRFATRPEEITGAVLAQHCLLAFSRVRVDMICCMAAHCAVSGHTAAARAAVGAGDQIDAAHPAFRARLASAT